jgi:hypothetical protein
MAPSSGHSPTVLRQASQRGYHLLDLNRHGALLARGLVTTDTIIRDHEPIVPPSPAPGSTASATRHEQPGASPRSPNT